MDMDGVKQDVLQAVDALWEDEVGFARDLVRFPSTISREKDVQMYIRDTLEDMGLRVEVFDIDKSRIAHLPGYSPTGWEYPDSPQVVGVLASPARTGRSLVLNGHVDVVPIGTRRYWTKDPWAGSIENGRLYGRGSVDMKAGIAAMLFAIKAIRQTGVELAGDVIVQTVSDEEGGGNGTLACLERGYIGDGCLIPEAFGPKILLGTGGINWLRTVVRGEAGHPMAGLQTVTGLDNAIYLIQGLKKLEDEWNRKRHPAFKDAAHPINFTFGTINAGCWTAMAPDECVFTMRFGFYPGTKIAAAQQALMTHLDTLVQGHPYLKSNPPEFSWVGIHCEGVVMDEKSEFIQTLAKAHEKVTGSPARTMYSSGSADYRFWPLYHGLPATCYGPAGGNPHGHDEYVDLASMRDVTKVIARFIMDWCGVADKHE
jgi:acetylornithine deacetylase